MHNALLVAEPERQGREASPMAAIIASQSVNVMEKEGAVQVLPDMTPARKFTISTLLARLPCRGEQEANCQSARNSDEQYQRFSDPKSSRTAMLLSRARSPWPAPEPEPKEGKEASADLLIAMIVDVSVRDGTDGEFVSHLDGHAGRLRSAGMAGRSRRDE
jgi:hypothetical protein